MNTKIIVHRFSGNGNEKPVRIGIVRGKRQFAIYLSDKDAGLFADVVRRASESERDGHVGEYEERD